MNVVIFKFNSLGDNVAFVSVVQALRSLCPDWNVTLLTTPAESELYGGSLAPQRVVTCEKRRFVKAYRLPWRLARWALLVKGLRPDACMLGFDQGNVAHGVAKWSGAGVRVGGNSWYIRISHSLTESVGPPVSGRALDWNWAIGRRLMESLGKGGQWPSSAPAPDLSHLFSGDGVAPSPGERVVIHAGANSPLQFWPVERYAEVARRLAPQYRVQWVVRPEIRSAVPAGAEAVTPATIGDLARLLRGARLLLCNNSGPMHLASALGTPGVAVTGPSAHGWEPFWHRNLWTVVRRQGLACAPCDRVGVVLRACANLGEPLACLRQITTETVESICRERLSAG